MGPVVRPATVGFEYADIEPGRDGETVVLASRLVLRIRDGEPYVTLGMAAPGGVRIGNPRGYAATSSGEYFAYSGTRMDQWFGGDPVDNAIVCHDRDGWEALPLPINPQEYSEWHFGGLLEGKSGTVYAVVRHDKRFVTPPYDTPVALPPWRSKVFRWDGGRWTNVSSPDFLHVTIDAVYRVSEQELIVGGVRHLDPHPDGSPAGRGYVALYDVSTGASTEEPIDTPATDIKRWAIAELAGGPDGRVWAVAIYSGADTARVFGGYLGRAALYVRESGRWRRIEDLPIVLDNPSPDGTSYVTISALAVDRENNVWLAAHGDPQRIPRLWKYDGNAWESFEVPAPQGYKPLYPVEDIFFDQAGDGWAIANVFGGVADPRHTPVLMHYRDGKWQLRGWSWHFWQQRLFGLPYLIGDGFV